MMIKISTNNLHYNKKTKTFVAEISDLIKFSDFKKGFMSGVEIFNPKTNKSKRYFLSKIDKDGSDEDIYGWNFENEETRTKLLIIND